MSERGVFAMDRGWFDHPAFDREPFTQREAWAWLIGSAAWKEQRIRVGSCVVDLARGQAAFSVRFLAERFQWSKSRVHRFLDMLKNRDMIGTDSGTGVTVITINNYSKYQRVSLPDRDTLRTEIGTGAGQERDKEEDIQSIQRDVVDVGARILSDDALGLAREIGKLCGYAEPLDWPPGWVQAPMRVQAWLNAGWPREMILGGCQEAMAKKRDGPPSSINYFEKPIASFIGRQSQPVPEIKIQERETVHVVRENGRERSKDAFRDALGQLREFAGDSEPGGPAVRVLPTPGRG